MPLYSIGPTAAPLYRLTHADDAAGRLLARLHVTSLERTR